MGVLREQSTFASGTFSGVSAVSDLRRFRAGGFEALPGTADSSSSAALSRRRRFSSAACAFFGDAAPCGGSALPLSSDLQAGEAREESVPGVFTGPSVRHSRSPKRPSSGRVNTLLLPFFFTSVYRAEAMVASGVLPWHLMNPRCRAKRAISPVDIRRLSSLRTATAADLKMPPPPGSLGSCTGGIDPSGGTSPGVCGLIAPSQRPLG
mmetsp:Transcript_32925/g.78126  ORF Transcript_32925/g.78126 Transcript_32925/m.78126 type:complete len:208 (-) Transcript_32925:387-1010(-)